MQKFLAKLVHLSSLRLSNTSQISTMAMASLWRIFNPSHGDSKPQKLPIHHHALHPSVFTFDCVGCSETNMDPKGYHCPQCKFYFHKECAESPLEINHPSHPSHPLKLRRCGPPGLSDGNCRLCGEKLGILVYHCSICNFSLDTACARKLQIHSIDDPKAHEHRLHLLAKHISFTCDACGTNGHRAPYLCRQCNFMIHRDCIPLPRVIHITRHEHRISRSYFIGPGKFACGVCRLGLDGRYGGYCCSFCPDYVVHLRCATRDDVWDGMELEGKPEVKDDIKDIQPFEVVHDKVIKHFSHEHDLNLIDDSTVCHDTIRCSACALPIYFDTYYICSSCPFALHKTCANLPRKLRHGLHKHPLTLLPNSTTQDEHASSLFHCTACQRLCSGFKYVCCDVEIDVRCCSIQERFILESHPHPLFLTSSEAKVCGACDELALSVLSCVDCDFALGFDCATLPNKVKHKCDTHFLSVCFGEKTSGQYWCEVCEGKINPNTRFYTCEDCSSTLHIDCVIGNFTFWRPGYMSTLQYEFTIVPNVFASRPHCHICHRRCKDTSGIICISEKYLCSPICLKIYFISQFGLVYEKSLKNFWDPVLLRLSGHN